MGIDKWKISGYGVIVQGLNIFALSDELLESEKIHYHIFDKIDTPIFIHFQKPTVKWLGRDRDTNDANWSFNVLSNDADTDTDIVEKIIKEVHNVGVYDKEFEYQLRNTTSIRFTIGQIEFYYSS